MPSKASVHLTMIVNLKVSVVRWRRWPKKRWQHIWQLCLQARKRGLSVQLILMSSTQTVSSAVGLYKSNEAHVFSQNGNCRQINDDRRFAKGRGPETIEKEQVLKQGIPGADLWSVHVLTLHMLYIFKIQYHSLSFCMINMYHHHVIISYYIQVSSSIIKYPNLR